MKDESDDEPVVKPTKKAASGKALTDFFDKVPAPAKQPATRKVSGDKPKPPPKKAAAKRVVDSGDDISMDDFDDIPPPVPKRDAAPKRAARAAPKTYVDISDDDNGGNSDAEYQDFD